MRRLVSRLSLLGLIAFAPSCSKPTEIVVRLSVTGGAPPSSILVKLHRSTPFPAEVPAAPPFVTTALNGADLDLYVTPQGIDTSLSLLWTKDSPRDLRVTVTVPGGLGYTVAPQDPVDVNFIAGMGQTLPFTVSAPPPDMGTAKDAGTPDGGVRDMATSSDAAPRDMAAPKG